MTAAVAVRINIQRCTTAYVLKCLTFVVPVVLPISSTIQSSALVEIDFAETAFKASQIKASKPDN